MASAEQGGKDNVAERGIGALGYVHLGIGAIALGLGFEGFAAYEGLVGAGHFAVKSLMKNIRKPKPNPAPA
jgi:hypothetical protein